MLENIENLENKAVELSDDDLEGVAGGSHSYITGDNGKSHVRTGPGLDYPSLGTLHREESLRYLHDTEYDDRGVLWYKVKWHNREAWVSSRYTRKERF